MILTNVYLNIHLSIHSFNKYLLRSKCKHCVKCTDIKKIKLPFLSSDIET